MPWESCGHRTPDPARSLTAIQGTNCFSKSWVPYMKIRIILNSQGRGEDPVGQIKKDVLSTRGLEIQSGRLAMPTERTIQSRDSAEAFQEGLGRLLSGCCGGGGRAAILCSFSKCLLNVGCVELAGRVRLQQQVQVAKRHWTREGTALGRRAQRGSQCQVGKT